MEKYQYLPLNNPFNIRLVTILPGTFEDPIRLEIKLSTLKRPVPKKPDRLSLQEIRRTLPPDWKAFEVLGGRVIFSKQNDQAMLTSWVHPDVSVDRDLYDPQDLNIDYEALSYTWGANKFDVGVTIENCVPFGEEMLQTKEELSGNKRELFIGRNLAEAIRHLRYEHDERVMWIDAICINQTNVPEKDKQVPLMGRIYTLARRVVAWLGPETPNTKLAFTKLDYLGRQIEFARGFTLPSPNATEPEWYNTTELPFGADVWTALLEVFSLSWFERLWVVQEIYLGPPNSILLCGKQQILWTVFRLAARRIHYARGGRSFGSAALIAEPCDPLEKFTFRELLVVSGGRLCADPRDRIYGLMSLASPTMAKAMRVDYSQSVAEVFKHAFLVSVEQTQRLEMLTRCPRWEPFDAPTWVPDWSDEYPQSLPSFWRFRASSFSASQAKYVGADKLEITGHRITLVSTVTKLDLSDSAAMIEHLSILGIETLKHSLYPTGETCLDAWVWTFCRALLENQFNYLSAEDVCLTFQQLRDIVVRLASGTEAIQDRHMLTRCWDALSKTCRHGKQVFTIWDGYTGTSLQAIETGDEVFIILGCSLPMIFRPRSSSTYQIISGVYIHGLMDGEGLLGSLPSPWRAQVELASSGTWQRHYLNTETQTRTMEDPRLVGTPLPPGWVPVTDWEKTRDDPYDCERYYNKKTGEVINSNPRLLPEALQERGLQLQTITIV